MTAARPDPTIGHTIGGKYRVVRLLGAGGMGAVYEVQQMDILRRAALKILTLDVKSQPGHFQRFMNEARAVNQISHPGVVQVHDFGVDEKGQPWLVMEYLEGTSLADAMKLPPSQNGSVMGMAGLWIIGELASALEAAHEKGIIHRDLKPANVMLVPDPHSPTGQRVKLLDFGVAKLRDADHLTKSGSILGTPLYMALEQFRNSADVDGKADVFSLGVIAYQLLSGRVPHYATTHYEIMGARLLDPIPQLRQLVPQLPEHVAALVMRMLEREPAHRPSMLAVDHEVRRTLGLPLPRKSGVTAAQLLLPNQDQPLTPTMSAPLEQGAVPAKPVTLDLGEAQLVTPSSERLLGEVSPRDLVVPTSLSSLPSVQMPLLQAQPGDTTESGAPLTEAPQVLASPSSPTAPEHSPHAKSGRLRTGIAVLGVLLLSGVALGWRWSTSAPSANTPMNPPSSRVAELPTAATDLANPNQGTAAPDLALPIGKPETPIVSAGPSPIATPASATTKTTPPKRCQPMQPTLACVPVSIGTRLLTAAQRAAVKDALSDASDLVLCPGESLVIAFSGHDMTIRSAPRSLGKGTKEVFINSLHGRLRDLTWRGNLEIKCPPR